MIDTNIVSAHFKRDPAVTPKLEASEAIYLPTTVLSELHFGAHRSPNPDKNLEWIGRFVSAVVLLAIDAETAALYGRTKAELTSAGLIIPDNDLWIGAVAKQHRLPLVSRDQHFSHVSGLHWLVW
ncbi:MAG: type II toxin-antitoxin system VapC family toxin [Chloroflexi bacterium]|nr:type II toxin-antitoxin system VapC family toxin [Chloroflexota bacterium]